MVIEPRSSSTPLPVDTPSHVVGSPGESTQEDRRAMEQHYRNSSGRMPSPLTRHGSDGELSPRSSPTGENSDFRLMMHNKYFPSNYFRGEIWYNELMAEHWQLKS